MEEHTADRAGLTPGVEVTVRAGGETLDYPVLVGRGLLGELPAENADQNSVANISLLSNQFGPKAQTPEGLPTKLVAYVRASDLEKFETGELAKDGIRKRVELTYLAPALEGEAH